MPEGWTDESFFARDIAPAVGVSGRVGLPDDRGSQPGMALP